jgi:hypothetical protein
MRSALVIIVLATLGYFFVLQKHSGPMRSAVPAAAATPRPVSEHDWAKHALDTTSKVKREVLRQRQSNALP